MGRKAKQAAAGILATAALAAGALAATAYMGAASHAESVAKAEPSWKQFPNSAPLADNPEAPGVKPLKTVAAWVNARQSLARDIQSGEQSGGALASFIGDPAPTACDAADGVGLSFVVNDFLADPQYRFMAARAICNEKLADKYLAAKKATEGALVLQPAKAESFSVGLIEGTGGQYLNEKIYAGPFAGFAKAVAAASGRPARANPFALNLTASLDYDLSGAVLGLDDDAVLVKPGNLASLLIGQGWRPVAQATNKQSVVLVGDAQSRAAIESGDFNVAMTSYQAILGRGAWALMREMIRSDYMPNSNGRRNEFAFHATQEDILRAAGGNTIGAVSPGVLEKFQEKNPGKRFEILGKSKEITHWMVLANPSAARVPDEQIAKIRARLIALGSEEKGKEMLGKLNIKGFEAPNMELVAATDRMLDERESILDPEFKAYLDAARRAKFLATIETPWQARLWAALTK